MRLRLYALLLLGDQALLLLCFLVITVLYLHSAMRLNELLAAALLMPMFITLGLYNGAYSRRGLTDWKHSSLQVAIAMGLAAAFFNFFAFFAKVNQNFSRIVFLLGIILATVAMTAMRYAVAELVKRMLGPSPINRLIIQAGGPQVSLPHTYCVDADQHGLMPNMADPHALNRFAHYVQNMDEVLVSCAQENRLLWSEMLKTSGVHGEIIDEYGREVDALGIIRHAESGITSLLVSTGRLSLRARATKRMFDLVVSSLALLMLLPLMLAVALLIKLEDGGPVFFRQRRMGRGNRFFEIYKFRSMREESHDLHGHRSAARDDDRVTRIGRFMRKTSIDELPQLINVLKGDMSIVGPRPHALGSQAGTKLFWEIDPKYWRRHVLRPGITGLAQIRGYRGATDTERDLSARLRADLEYMSGWSLGRDILILARTVTVLTHDRAF